MINYSDSIKLHKRDCSAPGHKGSMSRSVIPLCRNSSTNFFVTATKSHLPSYAGPSPLAFLCSASSANNRHRKNLDEVHVQRTSDRARGICNQANAVERSKLIYFDRNPRTAHRIQVWLRFLAFFYWICNEGSFFTTT